MVDSWSAWVTITPLPFETARLAEQPGQRRRVREERDWVLFAFLTTEANAVARPVHENAMPFIIVDAKEQNKWLAEEKLAFCCQDLCLAIICK